MRIIELDEVDSTNEYCKKLCGDEEAIVIAKKQSGGKGTKDRSFSSEAGGIYLSVRSNVEVSDFSAIFHMLINACVAVCKTLEKVGLEARIKWPNDVLVNGKKISGTLIENTIHGNKATVIIGIGINVNNKLPPELKEIATSVSEQRHTHCNLKKITRIFIENLHADYSLSDYKARIDFFGKEIFLISGEEKFKATALDVDNCGRLIVDAGGVTKTINYGEMSLRY